MSSSDAFAEFAAAEHDRLVRAAYLLTGNADTAQDLAQETLIRVLLKWRQVRAAEVPAAYARRVMLNVFLGGRRRKWTAERPVQEPEMPPTVDHGVTAADDRDEIVRLLAVLPPKQRAAVVLRHYEQRTESETAQLLGCPVGTVKSLTARGLARLRDSAATRAHEECL